MTAFLLSEILIPLTVVSPGLKVSDTEEPLVIEDDRPFLLNLRMLQEMRFKRCRFSKPDDFARRQSAADRSR